MLNMCLSGAISWFDVAGATFLTRCRWYSSTRCAVMSRSFEGPKTPAGGLASARRASMTAWQLGVLDVALAELGQRCADRLDEDAPLPAKQPRSRLEHTPFHETSRPKGKTCEASKPQV
jgi:hypothetical protein